jgi:hypothetical protein
MATFIRNGLKMIAAIASLLSGLCWHLSARAQLAIFETQGLDADQIIQRLNVVSQNENMWAAELAAVAGGAMFLYLFFADRS